MMDPPYTGPKMEAPDSPGSYVIGVPSELEFDEAWVYASRWVEVEDADGTTRFEECPLRWKELFNPQESDRLLHGLKHAKTLRDVTVRLECLYDARGRDDVVIYDDVGTDWKRPGVAPACPDISVIPAGGRTCTPGPGSRELNYSKEFKMLVLNLDSDIEQHLEMLGATTETSKTALARKALIEALEDMLDLRLAEARYAKQERSWTLEEIERGDDLAG